MPFCVLILLRNIQYFELCGERNNFQNTQNNTKKIVSSYFVNSIRLFYCNTQFFLRETNHSGNFNKNSVKSTLAQKLKCKMISRNIFGVTF